MKFDHVALEVGDLDGRIDVFVDHCGMRLLRMGTRYSTGQRIAMLGDGTGTKIELIEAIDADAPPTFAHLAFRVEDAGAINEGPGAAGWPARRGVHRLDAARADTALFDAEGIPLQIIAYDGDSPDDLRWDEEPRRSS